jgi:hypothetical protein
MRRFQNGAELYTIRKKEARKACTIWRRTIHTAYNLTNGGAEGLHYLEENHPHRV